MVVMKKQNKINRSTNQASFISLFANIILAVGKLIVGIIAGSASLISDAINSIDDVISTIVVVVGVKNSQKNPDSDHQFGHERMDSVAAVILSILFFITGAFIIYTAVMTIINVANGSIVISPPKTLAWIVAGVAVLIKEALFIYTYRVSKKANSAALKGIAFDHQMDVIATSISFLAIILAISLKQPILDPIASLIIGLLIIWTGIKTITDAFRKMTDHVADPKIVAELEKVISEQAGVVCIDVLRTRQFGNKIFVDVEIAVDGNLRLDEAHDIAERVHNRVEKDFEEVKHIMVHVNPADKEEKPS